MSNAVRNSRLDNECNETNITIQGKARRTQHMNPCLHQIYIYNAPQPKMLTVIHLDGFRQKRSNFSCKKCKNDRKAWQFLTIFSIFHKGAKFLIWSPKIGFEGTIFGLMFTMCFYLIQPYVYICVSKTRPIWMLPPEGNDPGYFSRNLAEIV